METEKRGRGRPKKNGSMETQVTVRLSPEQTKDLDYLVRDTGLSKAEILRTGLVVFAFDRRRNS